jgi:riboflavin kinase/FMN adenylyltransferase
MEAKPGSQERYSTYLAQEALDRPSSISIGVFDGVHLGHRYLLRNLVESARGAGHLSGVVTFDRHPDELLVPQREIRYLTTLEEKLDLLGELGLDFVVAIPFTRDVARTTARDFILALLERLQMKELWVGPDFALGKGRQGDSTHLQNLAEELGFQLHVMRPLTDAGEVISSSSVRALIREGRVSDAAQLLGRYPSIAGTVVHGARRGHKLGFPTANLTPSAVILTPANGVYAARVVWDTTNHAGVVNIGRRPTFEDLSQTTIEAHILDFTGDLYGKDVRVEFIERLRPEQRFESAEALISQMRKDVDNSRLALKELDLT